MTVFVESVDVDRAWGVYYQLADRRHKDGLTLEELRQVIEAALVGKVEAVEEHCLDDLPSTERRHWRAFPDDSSPHCRFVSPWVEVAEHQ